MAKLQMTVINPDTGKIVVEKQIDSSERASKEALATKRGQVIRFTPITPTTSPQPTPPPSLPIPTPEQPAAAPTAFPLPEQTGPTPEQRLAATQEYGPTRSFMGGLLDGVSLGSTLDDISKIEEEKQPVPYGAGKMFGEMVPNVLGDVLLARAGVPLPAASAIMGGLTGAIAGANEAAWRDPTKESYAEDALIGGVTGAGGGLVGSAVGAPVVRKAGGKLGEALGLLTGSAGKPVTKREAKELSARGMREEVGEVMAEREAKKTEKELAEKSLKTAKKQLKKPEGKVEKPAGFDEWLDELDASGGMSSSPVEFKRYQEYLSTRLPTIAKKIRTEEQIKNLSDEILKLDVDIATKQKLYASQLRRLAVPENLKQYAMEYWDRSAGAAGAAVGIEGPTILERGMEEGKKVAAEVMGKKINKSQRQVEAEAAIKRIMDMQAEEEKKKKTGFKSRTVGGAGSPMGSALFPE